MKGKLSVGDSVTFWLTCKLKSVYTDSKHCEKCEERQNEQ